MPLVRKEEPKVGDLCKGIVIEKDAAKKELILHLTYLCQEEEKVYINHLKCKGCIKDYDLVKIFGINVERRILYFHLCRQLSDHDPRQRNTGPGQKHKYA